MIRRVFVVELLSAAAALAVPVAIAQTSAAPDAAAAVKPIHFEVASIRLHPPGRMSHGPGFTDDGLTLHGMGVFGMIFSFFGAQRVEGVPDWTRDGYDIEAKVADADVATWKKLNFKQKDLAVQALLEDRFKLKWHRETRQMSGYALVVAKNGPKFKEATPGDPYTHGVKALNDAPLLGVLFGTGPGVFVGQAMTMAQLADALAGHAGRPVIDKTGLTGKYDVTFKEEVRPPPTSPASDTAAADPVGSSIFTVLQEQLGLKLESGATVPVEYLVVDHIERPTEN
jgi:uncharacterized protein (TIGR03435 family)